MLRRWAWAWRISALALGVRLGWSLGQSGQPARPYGAPVPYGDDTPLPIPPLRYFALDAPDDETLASRVAAYCRDDDGRLAVWFQESHPARLTALCGMYVVATHAPYHEQPVWPAGIAAAAAAHAQHCGTVVIPQGAIYTAAGLRWRQQTAPGHTWIEVQIDGVWETFDATVNVWYRDARARRSFWLPDYPGWDDHRRYCQDGWCYDLALLRQQVYAGGYASR